MYIYETRLASKKIFSPSNKIHREVSRAKDLSAPLYMFGNITAIKVDYFPIKYYLSNWTQTVLSVGSEPSLHIAYDLL
jgi:hypothetical protein